MKYREAIRDLWTDENGDYKLGLEHAITPEMVLQEMGFDNPDKDIYQIARTEINAVCYQICREGYVAGGISRSPTHYLIAKNPSEKKLISQKTVKNNVGRLRIEMIRADGFVNKRMMQGSINTLLKLIEDTEEEQPGFDFDEE